MRVTGPIGLLSCLLFLSGCTEKPMMKTASTTGPVAGAAIRGRVHGGQNPLSGAHVYLYAANNTGYGAANASVSLLTSNVASQVPAGGQDGGGNWYVTTDANGNFSITGEYTCPSTTSQLYLLSMGGDAGAGANSGAGLMAALGTCPANGALSSTLFVVVNEVSTIAMAYAVEAYISDPTHISSPNTALAQAGIANAFATVANLEDLSTGLALTTTPGGNGTVPQAEIYALANILAACVNSTGPTSTECTTLFNDAHVAGGTSSDTATSSTIIPRNPQANMSALFGLQTANAPFQPSLTVLPNDFTISINYTGGGLNQPVGVAIDGPGDVWVSNNGAASISEFGPDGSALSPPTGFTGGGLAGGGTNLLAGIAIDSNGNVWVANPTTPSLSEFNSSGVAISGSGGYTGGGLNYPDFLAVDASNNVWTGNRGDSSLSEFNSSGTAVTGLNGYIGGGLSSPSGIAIDISGNVWTADNGLSGVDANSLSEFTSAGVPISGSAGYTGGGLTNPFIVAIDFSGNIWVTNGGSTNSISEFNSSGGAVSGAAGYTGGGLNGDAYIAIDGPGNVYVANLSGNSISKFSSTGTAISNANGWQGNLNAPVGIAIDGAGNLWVANSGNDTIAEFVGLARGAVVTPIVANLLAPYGAHAVNKP